MLYCFIWDIIYILTDYNAYYLEEKEYKKEDDTILGTAFRAVKDESGLSAVKCL